MFNLFGPKHLPYAEVTPQEVAQKLKQANPLVVDVREAYEYAQGHIAGSKLISLGQLGSRLEELGSTEREIILVCRSGSRSGHAAAQLAALGYKKLSNLSGGMMAWQRAGLPIQR